MANADEACNTMESKATNCEVLPLHPQFADDARNVLLSGFDDDPSLHGVAPDENDRRLYLNSLASLIYHYSLAPSESFVKSHQPLPIVVKTTEVDHSTVVTVAYCNVVPMAGFGLELRTVYFISRWLGVNGYRVYRRLESYHRVVEKFESAIADYLGIPRNEINNPLIVSNLQWICTLPEKRGKGYGSAALDHVIRHFDAEKIPLMVFSSNPRNLSFYRRKGFVDLISETWKGAVLTGCARKVGGESWEFD